MNKLILAIISFLLLLSTACGGGSSNTNPPPPPPPPVTISANVAVDSATNGPFDLAMSTSFQPAEWDYTFFQLNPSAVTPLGNLLPSHIRLQTVSKGVPQVDANTWDFSILDAITQPVLTVGDHSPEMQLGWAPTFMWSNGSSGGTLDVNAFTTYTQNMVKYYNTVSGFNATDGNHVSLSGIPIQYWGVLNEPSINNIPDAATYTQIYNQVVPAMQSVDPTIKFVALELCCGSENWVSTFAQNVTAQVDAVATHYYALCGPPASSNDTQTFGAVPGFASSVQTIYTNMSTNAALSNIPVWITENNVNANFNSNGNNACGGGPFVVDQRGSSAFFAAWRPYVFSQVGKAGAHLLHHWDFDADVQYGEVNWPGNNQFQLQLSYWVDYWLARYFPGGSGQQLLNYTNSNNAQVEILPVKNTDGSVVIMVSNHAVASPSDNNGAGLTANISLDTSALGSFSSATQLLIDTNTNTTLGPVGIQISPASPVRISMNGYSVEFIKLTP